MISCDNPEPHTPGYHECMLRPDMFRDFKCGWADKCHAVLFTFAQGNNRPRRICSVTDMSITIDGELLPVQIETSLDHWRMSLKDKPQKDAIVHWTIVPCEAKDPEPAP